MFYPVIIYIALAIAVVMAAAMAVMAFELRELEHGWKQYMNFLEPPLGNEEIMKAAAMIPKSTEERARELDGRVPGTPSAALEETDTHRAWNLGENEEVS